MISTMNSLQQRKEEKAILATILKFFDGLRNRSAETMLSTLLPTGHAMLIRPQPEGEGDEKRIVNMNLGELVNVLTSITEDAPPMEENIALATWQDGDDGDRYNGRRTEIRVDGDLAVAWTPFEVRAGGEVKMVGTNIFNLLKRVEGERKGEWAISGVADTTRRKD